MQRGDHSLNEWSPPSRGFRQRIPPPPPSSPPRPRECAINFSPQHRHYPLLRNNYCRSCINERETKTSTLHRSWTTVPQLLSRLICDERRTKGGRSPSPLLIRLFQDLIDPRPFPVPRNSQRDLTFPVRTIDFTSTFARVEPYCRARISRKNYNLWIIARFHSSFLYQFAIRPPLR